MGKVKSGMHIFFDARLIFPPFFSFNIIEKRKKGSYFSAFSKKKYIFANRFRISNRYEERKEFFRN